MEKTERIITFPEGELTIKLGFNSKNEPVIGFYVKETGRFLFQMAFTTEEIIYCREYFNKFHLVEADNG